MRHIYRNDVFTMTLRVYDLEGGGGSFDLGFGKIKDAVHAAAKAELDGLKQELKDASGMTAVEQEFEALKADLQKQWNEFRDGVKKGLFEAFGFQMPEEEEADNDSVATDLNKTHSKKLTLKDLPPPEVDALYMNDVTKALNVSREMAQNHPDWMNWIAEAGGDKIPSAYILSVLALESGGDAKATNGGLKGAVGLAQIIPSTLDLLLDKFPDLKRMADGISGDPRLDPKWSIYAAAALMKDNANILKIDLNDPKNWVVSSVAYHDSVQEAKNFKEGKQVKYQSGYAGYNKRFKMTIDGPESYQKFVGHLGTSYSLSAQAIQSALQMESSEIVDDLKTTDALPILLPDGVAKRVSGGWGDARNGHKHEGLDVPVPVGTSIKAAREVKIVNVSYGKTGGNQLTFAYTDQPEVTYLVAHLKQQPFVKKGETYPAGTEMALSGNTGSSSGPHLHIEEFHNGKNVNPDHLGKGLEGARV